MSRGKDTSAKPFADLIKAARLRARMTQDDLAIEADVARTTIMRWEKGPTLVEPDMVRRVAAALGVDIREVVIALGYATRDEMALPPESPRVLDPVYADIIDMFTDPTVPARERAEWAEYLRWQHERITSTRKKGAPRGTSKAAPARSSSR